MVTWSSGYQIVLNHFRCQKMSLESHRTVFGSNTDTHKAPPSVMKVMWPTESHLGWGVLWRNLKNVATSGLGFGDLQAFRIQLEVGSFHTSGYAPQTLLFSGRWQVCLLSLCWDGLVRVPLSFMWGSDGWKVGSPSVWISVIFTADIRCSMGDNEKHTGGPDRKACVKGP